MSLSKQNHHDEETQPLVTTTSRATNKMIETLSPAQMSVLAITLFVTIYQSFFVVQPGNIAVVVTFGKAEAHPSGVYTKTPFVSEVITFSSKTQKFEESNQVPTKEGLSVQIETAILYRLEPGMAADVYKNVGQDYLNTILSPEAASAVRGLTSESDAKALYSSGRAMIQETLKQELKAKLEPRGIVIEDVLLKDLKLPKELSDSIEAKVKAQQDAERMQFVLQKEKQEAERKAIEAGGIASFQKIVSEGISPELLQWKGVEATESFAASKNTKIVIIGNGKDGLPVILSSSDDSGA